MINPGVIEDCNGIDDNCDAIIDEGFDMDGDGVYSCFGDCDDNNSAIATGFVEICDGLDNNCQNGIDEGFDNDGDGFSSCQLDCDDNNDLMFPGNPEVCDGLDNDCNGLADDGVIANPSISATLDQNGICSGDLATFTLVALEEGPAPFYQWQINSVDVAGENNTTFSSDLLVDGDIVSVYLLASNDCQVVDVVFSSPIEMTVFPSPVTPTIVISSNDADNVICSGSSIIFNAATSNPGFSPIYEWFVNGVPQGSTLQFSQRVH